MRDKSARTIGALLGISKRTVDLLSQHSEIQPPPRRAPRHTRASLMSIQPSLVPDGPAKRTITLYCASAIESRKWVSAIWATIVAVSGLQQFPEFVFAQTCILDDFLEQPSRQFARMDRNGHCPCRVRMAQRNMTTVLPLKFKASLFERAY
jgi:hypothetical protein